MDSLLYIAIGIVIGILGTLGFQIFSPKTLSKSLEDLEKEEIRKEWEESQKGYKNN